MAIPEDRYDGEFPENSYTRRTAEDEFRQSLDQLEYQLGCQEPEDSDPEDPSASEAFDSPTPEDSDQPETAEFSLQALEEAAADIDAYMRSLRQGQE
jgi:hypothetical protein